MIRAEADLARFTPEEELVAVRMIHAAGMVGLEAHIRFTPGMAIAARAALEAGAPILCDARMVSPKASPGPACPPAMQVICTLHDPAVPDLAPSDGQHPLAPRRWNCGGPHLAGAVVAIGNAPTALFHLLNMLEDPACPRPAAIIGCPVGFVGAAESKDALMAAPPAPVADRAGPARRLGHHRRRRQRARQPQGMTMGKIICTGLGPGDPDLMSVRADRADPRRAPHRLFPQGRPRRSGAPHRRGHAARRRHRIPDGIPGHHRAALRQPGL